MVEKDHLAPTAGRFGLGKFGVMTKKEKLAKERMAVDFFRRWPRARQSVD